VPRRSKSERETYVGIELEPSIRGEKLDCWRLGGIAYQLTCSSEKRERSTHSEGILGWEQDTEVIKTAWNTHKIFQKLQWLGKRLPS
jgi:hypothetical protein